MNQKYHYFSNFISGFGPVINDLLTKSLADVKLELLLDGLVVYSTNARVEKIKSLKFFTNSFLLLHMFPKTQSNSVQTMVLSTLKRPVKLPQKLSSNIKTFRIVTSKENQSISIDPNLMLKVEKVITKDLSLRPNRSEPDVQFWFLSRSEGYGFFGARLTIHPDYAKVLKKGELRPEISDTLCLLSDPSKDDVFLDPFAGSGSLSKARASYAFSKILTSDLHPQTHQIQKQDAKHLDQIASNSIDKIVTDPPWGFYGEKIDITDLYLKTLNSFYRVLKTGGTLVVLVGDRTFFEQLLKKYPNRFILKLKLYVLISGKKAGIYKLSKI